MKEPGNEVGRTAYTARSRCRKRFRATVEQSANNEERERSFCFLPILARSKIAKQNFALLFASRENASYAGETVRLGNAHRSPSIYIPSMMKLIKLLSARRSPDTILFNIGEHPNHVLYCRIGVCATRASSPT